MTVTEVAPRVEVETENEHIPRVDYTPIPYPQFYDPEEGRLKIVIAGLDDNVRNFAFEAAHASLEDSLSQGRGMRGLLRRIVQGNLLRRHYLRKHTIHNTKVIQEQNNLLHFYGIAAQDSYEQAVLERFARSDKNYINQDAGEYCVRVPEHSNKAGELRREVIALIKDYIAGDSEIQDPIDFNDEAHDIIHDYLHDAKHKELRKVMGDGNVQANNIWQIAQNVKAIANTYFEQESANGKTYKECVDDVLKNTDFIIGKARVGPNSSFKQNKIDRIIEKIGRLPFTQELGIVGATSLVCALGGLALQRTINAATWVIAPNAAAATWAGRREARIFDDERIMRSRYLAAGNNMFLNDGNKSMRSGDYEMRQMTELTEAFLEFFDTTTNQIRITSSDELRSFIKLITECRARLELSVDKDLMSASNIAMFEYERNQLLYTIDWAERWLKYWIDTTDDNTLIEWGVGSKRDIEQFKYATDETDREEAFESFFDIASYQRTRIQEDIQDKDKATNRLRRRRAAMIGGYVLGLGTVLGTFAQEIGALANPRIEGLAERWINNQQPSARGHTLLRTIAELLHFDRTPAAMAAADSTTHTTQITPDTSITAPAAFKIEASNGTLNITGPNTNLHGLAYQADGTLTSESLQQLETAGFRVEAASSQQQHVEPITRTVSAKEYIANNPNAVIDTSVDFFYTNNTARVDGTETILHYGGSKGTDSQGNYVIRIGNLSEQRAIQGNHALNLKQAAAQGKLWLGAAPSADTAGKMFAVKFNTNGQAIIPKDSPFASLFSASKPGQTPVFNGYHLQIFEHAGQNDKGQIRIRPIATHIGQDNASFTITTEQVKTVTGSTTYTLHYAQPEVITGNQHPQFIGIPFAIPIYSRGTLLSPVERTYHTVNVPAPSGPAPSEKDEEHQTDKEEGTPHAVITDTESTKPGRHRAERILPRLLTGNDDQDTELMQQYLTRFLEVFREVDKAHYHMKALLKAADIEPEHFHYSAGGTRIHIVRNRSVAPAQRAPVMV